MRLNFNNGEYTMKLDTKLKLLTLASVGGIQATTIGAVMVPALKENKQKATAIAVATVGVVTAVVSLRKIHEIDKELNLP